MTGAATGSPAGVVVKKMRLLEMHYEESSPSQAANAGRHPGVAVRRDVHE